MANMSQIESSIGSAGWLVGQPAGPLARSPSGRPLAPSRVEPSRAEPTFHLGPRLGRRRAKNCSINMQSPAGSGATRRAARSEAAHERRWK